MATVERAGDERGAGVPSDRAAGRETTASSKACARGIDYPRRSQEPDGTWFVHKRAGSFNPYFESGFPYGLHQFSSFAGTAWATMALMEASSRTATVMRSSPAEGRRRVKLR